MLLKKTLASLLITLSAVIPGTLEAKLPLSSEIQCRVVGDKLLCPKEEKEIIFNKDFFYRQGQFLSSGINYTGYAAGFDISTLGLKLMLGYDEERSKKSTNDELEIVGLKIEGKETLHKYQFWVAFGSDFGEVTWPYLTIKGDIQLTAGAHFEIKTLKPENTSKSIPTDPEPKPLLRVGLGCTMYYPFTHFGENIPIIRNFKIGIRVDGGYENIDLIGTTGGTHDIYLGASGIIKYSL
ncbi:hypothetical protein HQ489_05040 [Candidatus Woesearchaeota archaeon]|nr:hypothetical protein [Candidatus Woesearchaeota archaeon]